MIRQNNIFIIGVFLLSSFSTLSTVSAQDFVDRSHVGFSFGLSTSHSEIENPKTYSAFSAFYTYEVTDQFHLRGRYVHTKMGSQNDARYDFLKYPTSETPHFSYENVLNEGSILAEYEFYNLNEGDQIFTPYVVGGLGFVRFGTPYQKINVSSGGVNTEAKAAYPATYGPGHTFPATKPIMPLGVGMKMAVSDNVRVFLEGNLHNTFNEDYIDNVLGTDGKKIFKGDYYMTFQIGVTFRLGAGAGGGYSPFKSIFPPVYSSD